MSAVLNHQFDSRVSEFSSEAEAEAYTLWLRAQIEQRLADNKQVIPHDQVMARMDALLDKLTKKAA
jgi:Tfp pilus assembly protein PilF